jgi:hypothetical protein
MSKSLTELDEIANLYFYHSLEIPSFHAIFNNIQTHKIVGISITTMSRLSVGFSLVVIM